MCGRDFRENVVVVTLLFKFTVMKLYAIVFGIILLNSCSSKSNDNEEMSNVLKHYFSLVKDNKIEEIPNLFEDDDVFSGAIRSDAFFINKHYDELMIDQFLENIKIKDTVSIIPSQKQKYIEFTFRKSEDHLPVIMTFIFDEKNGFNKIYSPNILQNQVYWNKSLDSLNRKGIFPRSSY